MHMFLLSLLACAAALPGLKYARVRPIVYKGQAIDDASALAAHETILNVTGLVSTWFREVSYGKLEWNFRIEDVMRISKSTSKPCEYDMLLAMYDFSYGAPSDPQYTYTITMSTTMNKACGWLGLGSCSGVAREDPGGGYVFINGIANSSVQELVRALIHELGHNLGLQHENLWLCPNGTTLDTATSKCASKEYLDPMGAMGYNHICGVYNAIYKDRLGWLTPTLVTKSGVFTLQAIEGVSNNALKVLKSAADPAAGYATTYFYVEYRVPNANEAIVCGGDTSRLAKGVFIHFGDPDNPNLGTNVLQLNPTGPDVQSKYPLTVGNPFRDVVAGLTIRLASSNGVFSRINISIA